MSQINQKGDVLLFLDRSNWLLESNQKIIWNFIPAASRDPDSICMMYEYDPSGKLLRTQSPKFDVTIENEIPTLIIGDNKFRIHMPDSNSIILTTAKSELKFRRMSEDEKV